MRIALAFLALLAGAAFDAEASPASPNAGMRPPLADIGTPPLSSGAPPLSEGGSPRGEGGSPRGEGWSPVPALEEARWLAPDTDVVAFLTGAPGECLVKPETKEARYKAELGRAAFRSPLLLGGPAARYGLSCNSCHVNGRANPHFHVDGLSGASGTADVTSALFSKTREDGVFNPKPIPDLAALGANAVSGPAAHGLEAFIGSAVVDEFQGAPPPPSVLDGLAAYVGALDAGACATPKRADPSGDVRRAIAVADAALARGDSGAAEVALLSAQQALKRIAARLAAPTLGDERDMAEALSRKLAGARAILSDSPKGAQARIEEARQDAKRLKWRLRDAREHSLYDASVLREYLARTAGE